MWDFKGIIHFKMLPTNAKITAQVCCQQLRRLKEVLKKNKPPLVNKKINGVLSMQCITTKITFQKIKKLGYEKIPYLPYSPNFTLLNYLCFVVYIKHLNELIIKSHEEFETNI